MSFDTQAQDRAACETARVTKEGNVDERSRVLLATCVGAVAGGVWGWLYMTENGRRVRDQTDRQRNPN